MALRYRAFRIVEVEEYQVVKTSDHVTVNLLQRNSVPLQPKAASNR